MASEQMCQSKDLSSDVRDKLWDDVRALLRGQRFIQAIKQRYSFFPDWFAALLGRSTPPPEYGYQISFAELQRTYLRYLQASIVDITASLDADITNAASSAWKASGKAEVLGPVLRNYVQAVKDHEYMIKFSGDSNDPFTASSVHARTRFILEYGILYRHQAAASTFINDGERALSSKQWEPDDRPGTSVVPTRPVDLKKALLLRLGAALVGGAFLIGPMWLLVLKHDPFLQLGVATGCVSAFGLLAAWYLSTVDGVFAATLAYAAVIMVFIGVTMGELSPSNGD